MNRISANTWFFIAIIAFFEAITSMFIYNSRDSLFGPIVNIIAGCICLFLAVKTSTNQTPKRNTIINGGNT